MTSLKDPELQRHSDHVAPTPVCCPSSGCPHLCPHISALAPVVLYHWFCTSVFPIPHSPDEPQLLDSPPIPRNLILCPTWTSLCRHYMYLASPIYSRSGMSSIRQLPALQAAITAVCQPVSLSTRLLVFRLSFANKLVRHAQPSPTDPFPCLSGISPVNRINTSAP